MAAHIFIATAKGFVKGVNLNPETHVVTVEFTDRVRHAQAFSAKPAGAFMKKYNLEGFFYNPYQQDPVRDMYRVVKRSDYSIMNERENLSQEYYVQKAIMEHDTDISFLCSGKLKAQDLLTFELAKDKAIALNAKMFLELSNKIKKQLNLTSDKLWEQDDIKITVNDIQP
jgi:hypothetical protein